MGLRENDHGHRINGEFGFFDWLPTRGSRETDVDNANTAHRQGNTLLLLFNRADCSAFQTCKRVLVSERHHTVKQGMRVSIPSKHLKLGRA